MNKKGFTMVELLGTIVILGILMSVAIAAYSTIRERSAKKTYNLLHKGVADAAENYFLDVPGDDNITVDDLVEQDYLEPANDPWDPDKKCVGRVTKELPAGNKKNEDSIILKISIDGKEDFKADACFSPDAKIVLTYYKHS